MSCMTEIEDAGAVVSVMLSERVQVESEKLSGSRRDGENPENQSLF